MNINEKTHHHQLMNNPTMTKSQTQDCHLHCHRCFAPSPRTSAAVLLRSEEVRSERSQDPLECSDKRRFNKIYRKHTSPSTNHTNNWRGECSSCVPCNCASQHLHNDFGNWCSNPLSFSIPLIHIINTTIQCSIEYEHHSMLLPCAL
jgi:hypothetical protein